LITEFALNENALTALNTSSGGSFRLSGVMANFAPNVIEDFIFDDAPHEFTPSLVLDIAAVPEPQTIMLLLTAVACVGAARTLNRRRSCMRRGLPPVTL
jgi:hypothetical protein